MRSLGLYIASQLSQSQQRKQNIWLFLKREENQSHGLTYVLTDLNVELLHPHSVLCDNQGALTIASEPAQNQYAYLIANALKNLL